MKKIVVLQVLLLSMLIQAQAQPDRWQQKAKYRMDVRMDVQTNRMRGKQVLEYWNNSPDTLKVVFYHLYWNAFQPGSMMDARSQELGTRMVNNRPDWDGRVRDRISKLGPDEIGYQKVTNLKMNGRVQKTELYETILKVELDKPILPKTKVMLELDFEAQVPVQIRRSGRDNAEGVRYSMAQWYPKLCEYDYEGWHPTPYVAREFYGVWGDFDVNITIDKRYVIGGTGYLLNPQEIGHGYEAPGVAVKQPAGNTLTWKFSAPNVHDFVWAADPEYKHASRRVRDGLVLHAFYKISREHLLKEYNRQSDRAKQQQTADQFIREYEQEWEGVLDLAAKALPYIEKNFGAYPYKQYSFIQGGDGGMEYGMCTFITGSRGFQSRVGVTAHEFAHNWFQFVLASNETKHPWMDEGFTEYISDLAMNEVMQQGKENPHAGSYNSYFLLARSGLEEPLSTFSDRFETNFAYGISAYSKGCLFLSQLAYIIGEENLEKTIRQYYRDFRFKHPTPNDFKRTAEKVSGIQLEWYLNYWTQTTKTIDYAVSSINGSKIELKRIGSLPMPLDLEVTFADGSTQAFHIPLVMMYGHKPTEAKVLEGWPWVDPGYTFDAGKEVRKVRIDPHEVMADVNRDNNSL